VVKETQSSYLVRLEIPSSGKPWIREEIISKTDPRIVGILMRRK
jgi:hypothetical protein